MTTVSRALNGYPEVSEKTRQRVVEAARAAGYRANPTARRLAKGKAEAIGVVLPLPQGQFNDPFYLELLAGMGQEMAAVDRDLIVAASPAGSDELRAYRRLVEGGRVDALILVLTRVDDPRIDYLQQCNFPFLAYGRSRNAQGYAWLDIDNEQGYAQMTGRLVGLGHRRIALLNGDRALNFVNLRWEGYRKTLEINGIGPDPALIYEGDLDEEVAYRRAQAMLDLDAPPTAFLCSSFRSGQAALRAVLDRGLEPARDVSIIAFDDIPGGKVRKPRLTTLTQPMRECGARAAQMLARLLEGTPVDQLQELWMPRFVPGETDGPAPQ